MYIDVNYIYATVNFFHTSFHKNKGKDGDSSRWKVLQRQVWLISERWPENAADGLPCFKEHKKIYILGMSKIYFEYKCCWLFDITQ